MVVNRALFGDIVSRARGTLTKDDVDERGGPPRQKLAQIEAGDPIDLTPGLLSQIDTAFGWGRRTSEIVLSPVRPPQDLEWLLTRDRDEFGLAALQRRDGLGVDDDGNVVPLPPVLAAERWSLVMPVIARWRGPVLIDLGPESAGRDEELRRWLLRSGDVDRARWRRTGMAGPVDAAAIAIDPLPEIRDSDKAQRLLERIRGIISARRAGVRWPSPGLVALDDAIRTRDVRDLTPTLLFMAAQAHGKGRDGLKVLSSLGSNARDMALLDAWPAFHHKTGLSSRFEHIDPAVSKLLKPLLTLRDYHVKLALRPPQQDGDVVEGPLEVRNVSTDVEVLLPSQLDRTVVFFDSDTCPFLPVFIDMAYKPRAASPLLVTVDADNERVSALGRLLPNSHVVAITPDAALHVSAFPDRRAELQPTSNPERRADSFARLVTPRPGLTVLVPSAQQSAKGAVSQRVWLSATGESVSNRHEADTREATQRFYQSWRDRFGVFDTAQLDNRDGHPNLILTDDRGRRMCLWGLSLGHDGDGPAVAAEILDAAGMGTTDAMRQITTRPHDWPVTVVRPTKPLALTFGQANRSTRKYPAVDLRAGHGVLAGSDEATMTVLTEALILLRSRRSVNDVAVLGVTQRAARPWARIFGAHSVGFAGGLRDGAAAAAWLDTALGEEMWRRQGLLAAAQAADAAEYRAGGGRMPTLLVIVDGLDGDDDHWITTAALNDAVMCADQLDIRILLTGANPEPVRQHLQSHIVRARSESLPQFVFRLVLEGADPATVPGDIDRAHIFGPNSTWPAGFLWYPGADDALQFEPWQPETARVALPFDDEWFAAMELDLQPPVAEQIL